MKQENALQEIRQQFSETDRNMAASFGTLSDLYRYRIFTLLSHGPRVSVATISKILHITVANTQTHLRKLYKDHLLQKADLGEKVFPVLDTENPVVQTIVNTIQVAKIIGPR